jgi:hypothetical protein
MICSIRQRELKIETPAGNVLAALRSGGGSQMFMRAIRFQIPTKLSAELHPA